MRSTSRRQPEQAGSTLDESTFELLGDSLLEISDDEAHTESIASTTDDASDFSDDNEDYPSENNELQHSMHPLLTSNLEHHDSQSIHSPNDSTLTEVPAWAAYRGPPPVIRLDEQLDERSGVLQGSGVQRSFPEEDGYFHPRLEHYGYSQVRVVINGSLSQHSIPTPESYKILYVGTIEDTDEEQVSRQICDALTAGQNTVQGRPPPRRPVLHVYYCAEFQASSQEDGPDLITMTLKDGKTLTFGSARSSASDPRPDLVIFCHPLEPHANGEASAYASARGVFDREKIPCMDMIKARQYGSGDDSFVPGTLCVCIEARNISDAEYELQEVHPLDYYTFTRLDPAQVNRHLALISPHMLASTARRPRTSKIGDLWTSCTKKLQAPQSATIRMLIFLVLLTAMVSGFFFVPIMGSTLSKALSVCTASGPKATQADLPASFELISSSASHALTTPATSISRLEPPTISSVSSDLSLVPQPPKAKRSEKKKAAKVVAFTIETTNDQQFMLVPHADILNARKKPQLQIKVTRDAQAVAVRYNRTISGTYIVDLEQKEPFGTFNVSIASYSKPLLQQSFEITLGHNKSTLAQYFDSALQKLRDTQHRLNISTAGIHDIMSEINVDAAFGLCKRQARGIGQDFMSNIQMVKEMAARVVSVRPEFVKEVPEAAWSSVQQATAPVRRSATMLKARLRALQLRCKAETMAGLSREGKESWACSRVQGQE